MPGSPCLSKSGAVYTENQTRVKGRVKGESRGDDSLARVNPYIKYRGNNIDSGARVNVNSLFPKGVNVTS